MLKKILAVLTLLYAVISFAAVDVNTATVAELDSVKGIGPATSGRIIEERKKGSFKDWSDFIARVKGMGPGNAPKLSSAGLTVNDVSYAGAAVAPNPSPDTKAAKEAAKKPQD